MNLDELAGLYAEEITALGKEEPKTIVLTPLEAIAIAGHIQMAANQLLANMSLVEEKCELSTMTELAIEIAKQLQNLFNKESITYQVLETGWGKNYTKEEMQACESFDINQRK